MGIQVDGIVGQQTPSAIKTRMSVQKLMYSSQACLY